MDMCRYVSASLVSWLSSRVVGFSDVVEYKFGGLLVVRICK